MGRRHVVALPTATLCASLLAGAATAASPDPWARRGPVDARFTFGFQAVPKFDEGKGHGAWTGSRARGLALHQALGVQVSREGFIWRHFEPERGRRSGQADFDDAVNRLAAAGIAVQAMVTETPRWASSSPGAGADAATWKFAPPHGLDAPTFTDGTDEPGPGKRANPDNAWASSLAYLVRRYKGKVRYWQVWNEPDYPRGDQGRDYTDRRRSWNGSLDDYVRLLRVGWAVVKANDPEAQVVTGGIGFASYLDAMLARGAGRWLDQVDFHAYGWPGSDRALDEFVRVHAELRGVLDRHGLRGKRLICSETGYTANEPAVQAAYAAKLFPTALALGVETTMWYANVNPSWRQMGLVDWRTLTQKTPGWWAYRTAATALAGAKRVEPLGVAGARGFRFARADGHRVIVAWAPDHEADRPLAAAIPLPPGRWRVRDLLGRDRGPASGTARLALTAEPVWLDADPGRAYRAIAANPPLRRPGLAIAAAAADSANLQVGGAGAAIDLDPDSQWACGQRGQRSAWLRLDLTRPQQVRAVKLKTGPTPPGTWLDIEVSLDGAAFTPALTRARVDGWKMATLTLPVATRATAVRLAWRNPEGRPAAFGVFEVEVHGSAPRQENAEPPPGPI